MPGRIVLYGATGYTGRLTAQAMVANGARPVLAGRDRGRLAALAARLSPASGAGLETAVAGLESPGPLRRLLGAGDVLVSTAGPFWPGWPVRRGRGRGRRRGIPGLQRRTAVHPAGVRGIRPPGGTHRCGAADRVRVRLRAGQPGRGAGAGGGRAGRGPGADRLLRAREHPPGHERGYPRVTGRGAARTGIRIPRRPPGDRADRRARDVVRGRRPDEARLLDRLQ